MNSSIVFIIDYPVVDQERSTSTMVMSNRTCVHTWPLWLVASEVEAARQVQASAASPTRF